MPFTERVTATKAWVGAGVAGLAAGLAYLQAALPDGVTQQEWIGVVLAVLAGAGLTGGGVYAATNKPKV